MLLTETFIYRYKCISKKTWPNPKQSNAKDSVDIILKELNLEGDVRFGLTKVFIRSPQTVFTLETKRSEKIPQIVMFLQKVKHLDELMCAKFLKVL